MTRVACRILALIEETSTRLPADALAAIEKARRREAPHSRARAVFDTILENARIAAAERVPLCQDTGTLSFFVPLSLSRKVSRRDVAQAVEEATKRGLLRQNTIDSISGLSHPSNVCSGAPSIYWTGDGGNEVSLLMKGGGSENMSAQFSLPDSSLSAGRDMDGVRKCVLAAVQKAQGFGCAPGILGVAIGGDRAAAFAEAKRQLLRRLDDVNPDPALAKFERRVLREANSLGIGPMGLGGKTTLLGVKAAALPRVPASYFVTVAYLCWAARRGRTALR